MVLVNQPLTRVVGVQWGSRYFIRLLLLNNSPQFLCTNGGSVMTRGNVLFYAYNLFGDPPDSLIQGDTGPPDYLNPMWLGGAFNSLPLLPLDPEVPCAAGPGGPNCGVRTYGDPEDPGFDDLAIQFSNVWGLSGFPTNQDNFLPGIRVRFTSYDPATCDIVGGFQTAWTAKVFTYEMPEEKPTLTGSSYMSPETAMEPEDAVLIYSEEIVYPPTVVSPSGDDVFAFYFFRDEEGRGRIRVSDYDGIDPDHGLPPFSLN